MKENLLPNYFKKIAISSGVLAIILWLIIASTDIIAIEPSMLTWILKLVILASLFAYVFTKEKKETEKISELRITNIITAVGGVVAFLIMDTILELMSSSANYDMISGYEILLIMLLYHSVTFYFRKNIKTVVRA